MKKPDVIPGQLSIFDSPFKEILAGGGYSPTTQKGEIEMTNQKPIKRKKLNDFIRTKLQVPGYKFAEFIGVSAATVQKWLYGEAAPSTNKIRKIAKDCGITFTEACELFDD